MKWWLLLIPILVIAACKKTTPPPTPDPVELTPYEFNYPNYVPMLVEPADNPTTVEGVELGRKLYYDPMLSEGGPLDGKACASCHQQEFGFTTPGPSSPPVIPHVNLGWSSAFLWDGRKEAALEEVMQFEVSEFFQANIALFENDADYRAQFKLVFGDEAITHKRMAKAMAQFLRTVNSYNSKIDSALQGQAFLSDSEMRGYEIFNSEKGDCFHCHSIGLFTDGQFHNTGLEEIPTGADVGRYAVTGNSNDLGKFKTPTLRNVALRGPYMHDGRFATLEEVIEFYDSGVHFSATLDPIMTKPGKENGLNLTTQEKEDLVNFMKALTDQSFTTNPNLSAP